MEQTFDQFICCGTVGQLTLGMSRSSVLRKLGEPVGWLGKPPCFGPRVLHFSESNIWFYYADAVGVEFDEFGLAVAFRVSPEKFFDQGLFANWPVKCETTMSQIRAYLLKERIPFYDDEGAHFMLVYRCCVIQTLAYFRDGKPLSPGQRPVSAISVFANEKLLPNVGGRRQREWSLLRAFFISQFSRPAQLKDATEQISAYINSHADEDLSALSAAILNFVSRFEDDKELREKLSSELGCDAEFLSVRGWLHTLAFQLEHKTV